MNKVLKSLLQTAVYMMEDPNRAARHARDRIRDGVYDGIDQVQRRVYGEDHSWRSVLFFAAGVGLGLGVGLLAAPARGEETRAAIANNVREAATRIKPRGSAKDDLTASNF